jgi:hypothetical protein
MVCLEDYHFTPKALFYLPNFGEGIANHDLIVFGVLHRVARDFLQQSLLLSRQM